MRRAARTDGNHSGIVKTLRKIGCLVVDLSRVGNGIPDLLIGFRGKWLLMEVKNGSKSPSARKLTEAQEKFRLLTTIACLPHVVVETQEQAVDLFAKREPPASKPGPFDATIGVVK